MESDRIRAVIADQMNDVEHVLDQKKIIERENLTSWQGAMGSKVIKVVTGVRRTGKSVFALQMLKGKKFAHMNFDDERLAGMKSEDLDTVLKVLYGLFGEFDTLLLDEVQDVANWELFVNRLQRGGMNIVVTGSNARLLSGEMATHLTGRHIPIEIYPFSFREFLRFNGMKIDTKVVPSTRTVGILLRELDRYIKAGGFPEVLGGAPKDYLPVLYSAIIAKDVVSRYGIKYPRALKEIANCLMSNHSGLVSYNRLRRAADMRSTHTVENYVTYLCGAYLFRLVDKYSPKYREIVRSQKKVYPIDTGMIHAVGFGASENVGSLMEDVVALELVRRKGTNLLDEIYYWRDYQEREIDFLLKSGTGIKQLIQVSYVTARDEIDRRETESLFRGAELLGCRDMLLLTWDYHGELRKNGMTIRCIPLWEWLIRLPQVSPAGHPSSSHPKGP